MTMFTSLNANLPVTTRALIGFVDFTGAHKLQILLGVAVAVFIGIVGFRQPAARYRLDRLMLRMPVLGPVNLMNEMARFSQTMALLIHAGLPLPNVLDMAQQTTGNRVMRDAVSGVKKRLIQGEGLAAPMSENTLFPRLLVQMVKVGEESGNMESTLNVVAESYETEAQDKLSGLISMIEPTMTIIMGLMVAFIALSVITPMYSILSSVGH